jgi:hypothetical protein
MQLTPEDLARHDRNATSAAESGHIPVTEDDSSQHDAEPDKAYLPILSAADLARRNAAINDQRHAQLMSEVFDYGHVGWRRAEHREGWDGLLEPRAGRRR